MNSLNHFLPKEFNPLPFVAAVILVAAAWFFGSLVWNIIVEVLNKAQYSIPSF